MHRFFLEGQVLRQETLLFPSNISHQIRHVLRLQQGELVGVLDGSGWMAVIELQDVDKKQVLGRVVERSETEPASAVCINLIFPLSRREKIEWILQKGTEVGVSAFQPYISRRTLAQDASLKPSRRERWQAIIREAAEQSRRAFLPELHSPMDLSSIVNEIQSSGQTCLVADVGAQQPLGEVFSSLSPSISELSLIVGPEGGFDEVELDDLREAGVKLFSLGSRVLRMETAAIVVPALILYELGGLGASE